METEQFYIEIDGQEIPVSEEIYRVYKRPLWAEHKRKEREKRCRNAKGYRCDKDCSQCDKQRTGSTLSLDKLFEDGIDLAAPVDLLLDFEDQQLFEALHTSVEKLNILDRQITNLFASGKTEREIGAIVGLSQKAINKRKTKIFALLRNELKSFF